MICNNCEKKIDEDSIFCPSCGHKVSKYEDKKIINVDKEVLDHLEFLGYEINKLDLNGGTIQRYMAFHKSKPNLIFNTITDIGISFASFYNINQDKVRKHYKEALEVINRMNNQALFCSFYLTEDCESCGCSTMYLGKYNKKQFADFLDVYEYDIRNRLKAEEDSLKDFS